MKNIKKLFLVALLAVLSAATVWGEDITIEMKGFASGSGTGYVNSNTTSTISGVSFTALGYIPNSGQIRGNKTKIGTDSNSNFHIYNTTAIPGSITQIVVNVTGGNFQNHFYAATGTSSQANVTSIEGLTAGTASNNNTRLTWTFNESSGITFFKLCSTEKFTSGSVTGCTITITYSTSGGDTPTHTLTYSASNGSISGISGNTAVASGASVAEGSTVQLTATPNSGYMFSSWAISGTGSTLSSTSTNPTTFTMGTADATVTANFSVIAKYTVTLYDDGTELTQASGGAAVTLPSRSDISDYSFAGWSTENLVSETTTAPTIIPAGDYTPTSNITLYPIYSKTTGSGGTSHETTSVVISQYATDHSWGSSSSSGQKTIVLNSDVSATCNSGTNSGKYYNDGWRIYQNESGKITISTSNGELTLVTITYTNDKGGTLNYNSSAITSANPVNVSGNKAEFTVGNSGTATNGQVRVSNISVNYDIQGAGTTYYWSNPVAAEVEMPEIVVAENPFLFSTTVTITCATEGATIKYSYDGTSWNTYTSPLTISETKTIYAKAEKDENESTTAIATVTKNLAKPTVSVVGELNLDLDGKTDVNAGTLTASVKYNSLDIEGASVNWSSSNSNIATINASTGAVILKATGEVTFTATYSGDSDYDQASGTKTVMVIDSKVPGSQALPYTVSEARSAIDAGTGTTNVYVQGIISQIDSYNSTYHSITYWISTDGSKESDQLEVYSGKGLNGADFSSIADLSEGAEVVVYGTLKKYNDVYEFDKNNELASYTLPDKPIIAAENISIAYDITEGSISYTVTNPAVNGTMTASTTADWLSIGNNADSSFPFTCTVNDGNADRTATVTLTYTYNTDKTVTKNITVTQAHFVVDYAELPFSFDSGKGDIESTIGLTQSELGTDYNSSPKLKFDTTGDNVILKINEQPGILSFDIKGNSLSGNYKFSVLESVDGTSYSVLAEYNSISSSTERKQLSPTSTIRYIKWEYTTKVSGNVAIGNISLEKAIPVSAPTWTDLPTPSINIGQDYSIDLKDYVSANPNPTITVATVVSSSLYEFEDGLFIFQPTESGDYTFTFTAENTEGTADATLTVSVNPVMNYAILPFSFDGGYSDISLSSGLTQDGINSKDYASSPKLKFDTAGDYLILTINEIPGTLSFDINGNSFSGGTFTVLISADGVNYTELASYTELGNTQSESFDNLPSYVRYIKWIYTEKNSGNVGLGNIRLAKPTSAPESISINATPCDGRYWASFYNSEARYTLSEGAQAYTMNSEYKLYLLGTGNIIPENMAVIIISNNADITLTKSNDTSIVPVRGNDNKLIGSDTPVSKYSITGTPYVLGIVNGVLGFYQFNGDGIPANKAYYVVNN